MKLVSTDSSENYKWFESEDRRFEFVYEERAAEWRVYDLNDSEKQIFVGQGRQNAIQAVEHYLALTLIRDLPSRVAAADPVYDALAVMVLDPVIRKFLKENDPKALEQAENALKGVA